jgi:hypothetical protein
MNEKLKKVFGNIAMGTASDEELVFALESCENISHETNHMLSELDHITKSLFLVLIFSITGKVQRLQSKIMENIEIVQLFLDMTL